MRRQLALLLVTALLPLALGAGVLEAASIDGARADMRGQALDHARAVAALVGRELAADKREAEMLAQSPSFDHGFDADRFAILANRLVAQEPLWHVISVSDITGVRVSDSPFPIGRAAHGPVVDRTSQQEVVRTGRPIVGQMVLGPEHYPAFAVRAPVVRFGKVQYVVSIIIEPRSLKDLLVREGLPNDWIIRVVDSGGGVIVACDLAPGSRLSAKERPAAVRANAGWNAVALAPSGFSTWRDVLGTTWKVQVAIPEGAYNAPLIRGLEWLATTLGGALVLAALLTWLLLRDQRLEQARNAAAVEGRRLEALGRMTGGVAHDFNNLLTPIIGGLDLLQRRLEGDAPLLRLVDLSMQSAERAKALVGRLLAFSRKQTLQTHDVEIAGLLTGLEDLIRGSIGPNIDLRLDIPREALFARADHTQLELAILNLVVNANDAMPTGGVLRIAAAPVAVARPAADLPNGRYVRVDVSDTGPGMAPEVMKMAIEPFFTTKAIGAGTGLGLSMVHGLAAQSGGALRLRSPPGQGLTAEIWLPAGAGPARIEPAAPEAAFSNLPGVRILLVDDNDPVRASTAEILKDGGHMITEAGSAAQALAILRSAQSFDLLVTDFIMPGGSGADLIRDARGLRPDLRALVLTGYLDSAQGLPIDVVVMAKPYRRLELLQKVRAAIQQPVK